MMSTDGSQFAGSLMIAGYSDVGTGPQDYGVGVVRLGSPVLGQIGARRGSLVLVTNVTNGRSIHAIARGLPDNEELIAMEYDQRVTLGVTKNEKVDVRIRRSDMIGWFQFLMRHPNPMYRIAFLYSALLAFAGVVVGFLVSQVIDG